MLSRLLRLIEGGAGRPLRRAVDRRIRALVQQVPIDSFAEGDIFIVGYPKSGNTWFQNLVAGIAYGTDPYLTPDTVVQELVPAVHSRQYYKRFGPTSFFLSHHLPRRDYRRVVYLLRDGRDVMVSYYHFRKAVEKRPVDFLRMVRDGDGFRFGKWHRHVEAWLANPHGAELVVIKYEDLRLDPAPELRRFCEFAGIDREDDFLVSVAEKASFEKMREREDRDGWDNPHWPEGERFVRRGHVGSYKDEMPPEVQEAFREEAGDVLVKCGYPVE